MFRFPRISWPVVLRTLVGFFIVLGLPGMLEAKTNIPDQVYFNRDVRPIMSNACLKCHGPDLKANEADLRLDLPANAYRTRTGQNGNEITPLVLGHPEKSEAWRRISSKDEVDVMPPIDNLHQLTDRDKAIFKRWIEQGAEYESHWAYLTPRKTSLPEVKDSSAIRNEVDAFIVAEHEKQGVDPAVEANRSTLIRRLSLDLIGLPSLPEEVDQFVNDTREDAYERLVDRLLASPHYGERMAVPWLDVVRFADTVGFHGDQGLNIFPYRDYVINAFNQNKPYDEFVIEQIAGDLLPNPSVEQLVATGFNRLNMVTREGGAQTKEYLAKYAADRVRAVSTTFLGSTMACTECHDHKFDPFTTKDFYSMAAFFADIKQYGVYSDYGYTPEPELIGWSNDFPFPPEIEVKSPYLVRRQARLERELAESAQMHAADLIADVAKQPVFNRWCQDVSDLLRSHPTGWKSQIPDSVVSDSSTEIVVQEDASALFLDREPGDEGEKKKVPSLLSFSLEPGPLSTLRLELLPDPVHDGNIFRGAEENTHAGRGTAIPRLTVEVQWEVRRAGQEKSKALTIASAYSNLRTENYFNGFIQASVGKVYKSSRHHSREPNEIRYFLKDPVDWQEGDELLLSLKSDHVGRVRISTSPLGLLKPGEIKKGDLLDALMASEPTNEQKLVRAATFVKSRNWFGSAYPELHKLYQKIAECRNGYAFTVVTQSTEPLVTRVLGRGNWKDESGEIVSPSTPRFLLNEEPVSGNQRQSRLDLAHWITSPDNPLTARTFVNRVWAQFFGTGLSTVLDDLGNQGGWPSHPNLLDWLAVEFVESGWDVKSIIKKMVSSGTYRQSSRHRPELASIDPDNRLLARQNPRRLDAEFVRDNALYIAGLIDREIGGPSSKPYQPEGYYAPLNFPVRKYQNDTDDRQYRRGLYSHWQRTFLHPMLANFDAPSREECTAQRTVSNTPQQALTLLNDPSFVEAARVFAQSLLSTSGGKQDFSLQLDSLYKRALARSPSGKEEESLTKFYTDRLNYYGDEPEEAEAFVGVGNALMPHTFDPVELAAWSAVARVVLNLNETIVRY